MEAASGVYGLPALCRPSRKCIISMEYYIMNIYSMDIFCLKCKIKTETNELTAIVFRNGVPAVKGKCAQCGTLKFLITPRRQASRGGSLVNSLLNKLPMPEMHMGLPEFSAVRIQTRGFLQQFQQILILRPVYKATTTIKSRLQGVNKLDEACQQHVIAYATSSEVEDRNKADDVLCKQGITDRNGI